MPPVFGRLEPNPHPSDPLLEDLLSQEAEERAVACNVLHDGRVSKAREQEFDGFFKQRRTGQDLLEALEVYQKTRVRDAKCPDFADDRLNGENILTGTPSGEFHIHKQTALARVVVLNRLRFLHEGNDGQPGILQTFGLHAGAREQAIDDTLDRLMRNPGAAAIVPAILTAMNESPHHPTWVTLWSDLDWENEPPERWLEAVGIHEERDERWVVVLKYRVEEVHNLVRPTILDAGKNSSRHFPSPVMPRRPKSGHPMDLQLPPPSPGLALFREWIHTQIDHVEAHWRAAGSLCEKTRKPSHSAALVTQRNAHHQRLRGEYGVHWVPAI